MAALFNETSASDGDIFPSMFKQAGLGPLIGKRSWGGVVGITDHGPLIDGGSVFVPEFGLACRRGLGHRGPRRRSRHRGRQRPAEVLAGHDPQLERAVAEVMAKIAAKPPTLPPAPAPPVKTQ